MSSMGLRDVEKIERFYLNSCTDLPVHLAKSLHQSFPALNEDTFSGEQTTSPRISRSQSGRSVTSKVPQRNAKLNSIHRAKLAFFKICDSLAKGIKTDFVQDENPQPQSSVTSGSCHLIMNPSMSKEEFIQKLEQGMVRSTDSNENPILPDNPREQLDHHHTQSDSVLAKSTTVVDDIVRNVQNQSKSTTAIEGDADEAQLASLRSQRSSAASKVIVTGILLIVFFGLLKNATSRGG